MKGKRYCKNKCTSLGRKVTLYQDGPISPIGTVTMRCPVCGFYDFEFPPKDTHKKQPSVWPK